MEGGAGGKGEGLLRIHSWLDSSTDAVVHSGRREKKQKIVMLQKKKKNKKKTKNAGTLSPILTNTPSP